MKDEFEHYKSKAQHVRKTKAEREAESGGDDNTEKLRQQVAGLQSTLESLRLELESSAREHRSHVERTASEMAQLQLKQNLELENERTVYGAKLQELESQVRNQRSRTLSLISEKDCDIERLKEKLEQCLPAPTADMRRKSELKRRSSNSDAAVNELLSQSSPVRDFFTIAIAIITIPGQNSSIRITIFVLVLDKKRF